MKRICFLFVLCFILFDGYSQNGILVFRTSEEITVRVYKPIDDTYNFSYISDKLELKPNISINYELEVKDFAFVMCRFPNGHRRLFLVLQGDRIKINYEPQKIIITGNNAEGHNYYNDNYIDRGLGYYLEKMDTICKQYFTNTTIDYDSINYYFQKKLIASYQEDLKKMEMSGGITPKFSSVLSQDLYMAYCSVLMFFYQIESNERYQNGFKLSPEDIRNIMAELSKWCENPYVLGDASKKMHSSLNSEYYFKKYKYSDTEIREKLTEGYDKDCFGRYAYLLFASDSIQLQEFSTLFIQDLQNGTNFFNHEKMLSYLSNKFPNSEYVAIIKKMMAESQSKKEDKGIIILNDSITSIKELMQIPGIKGKYAYIDLWETSCMPCVMEFEYQDEIHKLLAEYDNIVPVYISIDTNRSLWESRVMKFNLKGYNIMASKSLQEDIGIKVYKAKKVGAIPRYLLLDPEGNILNDNLPRPSKSAQLKPIFAGVLK